MQESTTEVYDDRTKVGIRGVSANDNFDKSNREVKRTFFVEVVELNFRAHEKVVAVRSED